MGQCLGKCKQNYRPVGNNDDEDWDDDVGGDFPDNSSTGPSPRLEFRDSIGNGTANENRNESIENVISATTARRLESVNVSITRSDHEWDVCNRIRSAQLNLPFEGGRNDSVDFPFFWDEKSVSHVLHSKTMFIMRGPPGSGKSTLVNILVNIYRNKLVVCSADHYFTAGDGSYNFNAKELKQAHKSCQDKADKSCRHGNKVIVIDNTSIQRWETREYIKSAKTYGYTVVMLEPLTNWRHNVEELVKRNTHNVDETSIRNKIQRFEDFRPFFFGWFLTEDGSRTITDMVRHCLIELSSQEIPEFKRNFPQSSDTTGRELCKVMGLDETEQGSHTLLHCTAKFLGSPKNASPGSAEYNQRKDVRKSVGKASDLVITSIVISPRTIGARVQLTSSQLKLFDRPEERLRDEAILFSMSDDPTNNISSSHDSQEYPEFGRSAHLTVGRIQSVRPVQTNFDILDACDYMHRGKGDKRLSYIVTGGRVEHIGEDIFVMSLKSPLTFPVMFSGHY